MRYYVSTCSNFLSSLVQLASKLLGVACYRNRNFMTAMIPDTRRHLKKCVLH